LRAIEEGLPIVRSANTGISAVIDPVGRVIAHLGLGTEGVLDSALPAAIAPTPFSRVQDIPTAIVVALSAILLIRRRAKQKA
jgi:apolipoprotein N-acyltransferase